MTTPTRTVHWPILIGGLLSATAIVLLLAMGFNYRQSNRRVSSALIHNSAPNFSLQDLEGATVTLSELRGRPVVINFWSTWCIPCKQEHPVLQRFASQNRDITFLGVVYQDERAKVLRYLQQKGSTYRNLFDPTGSTSVDYAVTGVPETYFIDANGVIQHKTIAALNPMELQRRLQDLREVR